MLIHIINLRNCRGKKGKIYLNKFLVLKIFLENRTSYSFAPATLIVPIVFKFDIYINLSSFPFFYEKYINLPCEILACTVFIFSLGYTIETLFVGNGSKNYIWCIRYYG